jgi:hypothetical protein
VSKKLIIHIGLPKTGSSYIQDVLNGASKAGELMMYYPVDKYKKISFVPTSGNGVDLCIALIESRFVEAEQIFSSYFEFQEDVVISSEMFAVINSDGIGYIGKLAKKYSVDLTIIAFVRDLYEYFWSGYSQTIKRSGETRTFLENARERPLCIDSIYEYSKTGRMDLSHYNRTSNILEPFIRLGVLKEVWSKKIPEKNIALTKNQMRTVKLLNKFLPQKLVSILSDFLSINNKRNVIQYDEQVDRYLIETHSSTIKAFNEYFGLNVKVGYAGVKNGSSSFPVEPGGA